MEHLQMWKLPETEHILSNEDADFAGEPAFQIFIATDIPANDKIKFTDVTATIDGKKVLSFDEGWMENEDPYIQGGEVVVLLNH